MKKYDVMIAGAGVLWGLISIFFKRLGALGLDGFQVVCSRFAFAAVLLGLWLAARDRRLLRVRRPAHLLYFVGSGVCSLAFFNFCYYTAIERAGVGVAALLLYTSPAFVMLFSRVLFGETLTCRKLLALALTVLGCACVTGALTGGLRLSMSALLYGLGAGLGYALYSIFGKLALRHYAPETVTFYSFVFAALGLLPLSRPAALVGRWTEPAVLLTVLGLALLCTVGAYLLYTAGLRRVEPGRAAVLATVEPVVAAAVGAAVFRESVTADKLAGVVLILTAIVLLGRPERAKND